MIRVVIADDHPVVRQGLVALLESLEEFEVVAVGRTGREAIREVVVQRPDVALLDLQMPDLDGLAAIRELAKVAPDVAVCVLTMHDDDDSLFTAMQAGGARLPAQGGRAGGHRARGTCVARGEVLLAPGVAGRVLSRLRHPVGLPATAFPQLTPRELDVLDLVAAGVPVAAIAERLVLSPKTVGNNVSVILTKLGVADRAQAAVLARDAGMGRVGGSPSRKSAQTPQRPS